MLSSSLMGSDSTTVGNTTIRMVAGVGKTSKALAAPTTNPIELSKVVFLFQGNL
jgi:hypothetical protein